MKEISIKQKNRRSSTHKTMKCEYCGKSLSHKGHLKKHIYTVHEGYKDYKCESCNKAFSEASTLKKRIHSIHDIHKVYKCDVCSK